VSYVLGEGGEVEATEVLDGKFLSDGGALMVLWYRGAQYKRKVPRNGLITHSEAATLCKVRRESVWRWVQAGKLRDFKVRGVSAVSIADLRKHLKDNGYVFPR